MAMSRVQYDPNSANMNVATGIKTAAWISPEYNTPDNQADAEQDNAGKDEQPDRNGRVPC